MRTPKRPPKKRPVPKNSSSLTPPPNPSGTENPEGMPARAVPTIVARQIPRYW
jgi:hypothetical protein